MNARKVKIKGNVTNWPTYGWTTSLLGQRVLDEQSLFHGNVTNIQ
jgi:hypothetical protein